MNYRPLPEVTRVVDSPRNYSATEVRAQGDIPSALEQLHANVNDLEKIVCELADRLQTVIKPEPCPDAKDQPVPEPVRSPVANGICAAADNVHRSVVRLRRLESLIQL